MKNDTLFDLSGKVAVLTGAGGVLIRAMALELGRRGVKVVATNRSLERAEAVVAEIRKAGGEAMALSLNVLDRSANESAAEAVLKAYGRVDFLINGAGGNLKEATVAPGGSFFDLPEAALRTVMDLNLLGAVLPSQVFGRIMARQKEGVIINVSSMNSFRPLTRIVGYSAAKAAVNNFTQWLAVHLAQNYAPAIRVNAIAPGFFETAQNKFLLRNEADGSLTERGRQIIAHTPMGRFGANEDLLGALIWLLSPSAAFVTGIVVPVDGGFSAYSGV
jgi:NAD(P)-dependent dehydrogenase (short-subunit alcohol dehydrogenase family)